MRPTTTRPLSGKRRQRRKSVYEWKEENIEQVGENSYPSPKELGKATTSRRSMVSSLLEKVKFAGAKQKECMEISNSIDGLEDEQVFWANEYLNDEYQCQVFVLIRADVRLRWLKNRLTPQPCPPPNSYPRPVPQGHLTPPPYRRQFMGQNSNPYGAHMAEQTPHYGGYNGQPTYHGGSRKPMGSGGGGNCKGVNPCVFCNANGQSGVGNWSGYGNAYPGRNYGHGY